MSFVSCSLWHRLGDTFLPLHFGLFFKLSPHGHTTKGTVVVTPLCWVLDWGCQPRAAELPTGCHKVQATSLPLNWVSRRNLLCLVDTQLILPSLVLKGNPPKSQMAVSSLGVFSTVCKKTGLQAVSWFYAELLEGFPSLQASYRFPCVST